jgi:hypothetical protein
VYRAIIVKTIGWGMNDLMEMPWDEFLRELEAAFELRKAD